MDALGLIKGIDGFGAGVRPNTTSTYVKDWVIDVQRVPPYDGNYGTNGKTTNIMWRWYHPAFNVVVPNGTTCIIIACLGWENDGVGRYTASTLSWTALVSADRTEFYFPYAELICMNNSSSNKEVWDWSTLTTYPTGGSTYSIAASTASVYNSYSKDYPIQYENYAIFI